MALQQAITPRTVASSGLYFNIEILCHVSYFLIIELPSIVTEKSLGWTMDTDPGMHDVFHYHAWFLGGYNAASTEASEVIDNVKILHIRLQFMQIYRHSLVISGGHGQTNSRLGLRLAVLQTYLTFYNPSRIAMFLSSTFPAFISSFLSLSTDA